MQLDEGMDTGPVLLERRTPIDPDETSGELLARLAPIGAAALLASTRDGGILGHGARLIARELFHALTKPTAPALLNSA